MQMQCCMHETADSVGHLYVDFNGRVRCSYCNQMYLPSTMVTTRNEAIDALRAVLRWVPVTERLPNLDEYLHSRVFIRSSTVPDLVSTGFVDEGGNWLHAATGFAATVSHWRKIDSFYDLTLSTYFPKVPEEPRVVTPAPKEKKYHSLIRLRKINDT